MKMFHILLLLNVGLVTLASCKSGASTPTSEESLTSEQSQVYSDFLERFGRLNFTSLSNQTFSFNLSSVPKDAPCLQDLQFEEARKSSGGVHSLTSNVLRGRSIPLVSAQEESEILKQRDAKKTTQSTKSKTDVSNAPIDLGILALSEVIFDKSHHYAVLRYAFLCGSRCNSGAVIVLEKVGSQWTPMRRACSATMNQDQPRPVD
jgi:hypothetical protein